MRVFALVLFLIFADDLAQAQKAKCIPTTSPPRDTAARLKLDTSVAEARYTVESGSKLLRLSLNLAYRNVGTRPILLDKKSSLIYRNVVSKSLKTASACKYLYDVSSHFIYAESMKAVGFCFNTEPERAEFLTLKPGESVNLKDEIVLHLYDGTKDTKDELRPGNYVLQVRVAAWFYFADPVEWERKWGAEAYLWSENVTSEPMPFIVEKPNLGASRQITRTAN